MKNYTADTLMRIFLYLVALHSFLVGLLLMLLPPDIMTLFGYALVNERFFQIQAGVFHLVMVLAYLMAASDPARRQILVIFIYRVKFLATVFLFSYALFVQSSLTIIGSGLGDLIMGAIVLFLHRKMKEEGLYAY